MAIKGLSVPFFGKYTNTEGTVTYSEGKTIGHAIEYSIEVEAVEDNPLYGDNKIIEHDTGVFASGTLTLNTSELTAEVSAWLLGLPTASVTVGTDTVTEYQFNDNTALLTVGFGIIELHQVDDVDMYKTVVLPKCVPHVPSNAATTKGETIDWQTQEIEFTIEKSDASDHPWKKEAWHDSETDAIAYLQTVLGYTAG